MTALREIYTRIKDIYYIGGAQAVFEEIVGFLYRHTIRPILPTTDLDPRFGGVVIPLEVATEYASNAEVRLFDDKLPWMSPGNRWMYEHDLSKAIKKTVSAGDTVVLIGGGIGVTTVIAAREVAPDGTVIVYEGGEREVGWVKKTINENDVEGLVEVNHALVGPNVNVYSDADEAERLSPAELPQHDVLVSDCEGAERELIEKLDRNPDTLLVETHGFHGTPTHEMESLLTKEGYNVERVGVESVKRDVKILKATASSGTI